MAVESSAGALSGEHRGAPAPLDAVAVIPARFDSMRLPGKALADLHGVPMVVRVARRVALARGLRQVVVATDDVRIRDAVEADGHVALMTRSDHPTGTDRVAEAALQLEAQVVVNIQGDEPLVEPATIEALLATFADPEVDVATVASPLHGDPAEPARVKVVTDHRGRAIYFSRAPIPHGGPWRVHQGLYAFRAHALQRFCALQRGHLEQSERLEQLRLLEHGLAVQVVDVPSSPPSVDTPADLERVRSLLARRPDRGG